MPSSASVSPRLLSGAASGAASWVVSPVTTPSARPEDRLSDWESGGDTEGWGGASCSKVGGVGATPELTIGSETAAAPAYNGVGSSTDNALTLSRKAGLN